MSYPVQLNARRFTSAQEVLRAISALPKPPPTTDAHAHRRSDWCGVQHETWAEALICACLALREQEGPGWLTLDPSWEQIVGILLVSNPFLLVAAFDLLVAMWHAVQIMQRVEAQNSRAGVLNGVMMEAAKWQRGITVST